MCEKCGNSTTNTALQTQTYCSLALKLYSCVMICCCSFFSDSLFLKSNRVVFYCWKKKKFLFFFSSIVFTKPFGSTLPSVSPSRRPTTGATGKTWSSAQRCTSRLKGRWSGLSRIWGYGQLLINSVRVVCSSSCDSCVCPRCACRLWQLRGLWHWSPLFHHC